MASSPRTLHIAGTPVRFPHIPYRAQNALMHATITAMRAGRHALVESPTGTGKSLALLCATLAFQEALAAGGSAVKDRSREDGAAMSTAEGEGQEERRKGEREEGDEGNEGDEEAMSQAGQEHEGDEGADGSESDSDSDFATPKKFRDVSWQRPLVREKKTIAAEERPANAFMFQRLLSLERDRPLDSPPSPTQEGYNDPTQPTPRATWKRVPRIFYATRTHKQVSHVVAELRKSEYRPRVAVLASRREYCVRDEVREAGQRDEVCKGLVKTRSCQEYYRAQELAEHEELAGGVWDVEELTTLGRKCGACPYYASHELYQKAQLILCPYSFLVDPVVRGARGINLGGDVVVLDEAHNLEDYARESAGFAAEVADMRRACEEVDTMVLTGGLGGGGGDLAVAYRRLKGPMESFMTLVDTVVAGDELKVHEQGENAVFERHDLLGRLAAVGITEEAVKAWRASYEFISNYGDGNDSKRMKKMGGEQSGQTEEKHEREATDENHLDSANAPNADATKPACGGYGYGCEPTTIPGSLHIVEPRSDSSRIARKRGKSGKRGGRKGQRRRGADYSSGEQQPWVAKCMSMTHGVLTTLEYLFTSPNDFTLVVERKTVDYVTAVKLRILCLNAAVCFRDISNKARTVIVTSGTLAPIASFAGELGINFAVSKSLPHVIDVRKQLYVSVVGEGPRRELFDCTFSGSSKFSFQDALGEGLRDYCRVIPGGVLVFFPSYRLMDQLVVRWKSSGAWEQLLAAKGAVLVEPNQRGDAFDDMVRQYQNASESGNGAIMFGVCRGKLSEGVDFRDSTSRAVVLVGIPFPYKGEIVVSRKRQWNDRTRREHTESKLQSGAEWYEMQAFRALNQALGRAVRHRYDYGAILLLDCRFRKKQVIDQLPKWTRAGIRQTDGSHGALLRGLEHFYDSVQDSIAAITARK